jgi:hypothetical protein
MPPSTAVLGLALSIRIPADVAPSPPGVASPGTISEGPPAVSVSPAAAERPTGPEGRGRQAGDTQSSPPHSLGTTPTYSTPPYGDRLALRWWLRDRLADDPATAKRIAECGLYALHGEVELRTRAGSVYPAQLIVCGRPHWEPVCGAKIRARKATGLQAMNAAFESSGGAISFSVFTSGSHHLGDTLAESSAVLAAGWSKVIRGKRWERLKNDCGIVGRAVSPEWTFTDEGFNPHRNVLWYHERPLDGPQQAELILHMYERFKIATDKAGRYLHPAAGVKTIPNAVGAELGLYVAKVQEGDWGIAQETVRSDAKASRDEGGLVPFDMLVRYYSTGDIYWRDRFAEFRSGIVTSAGLAPPVVRLSSGLRERALGGGDLELTDEQLALAEVGGVLIAVIRWRVWVRIRQAGMGPAVLAAGRDGGLPAINELLAQHGLGWAEQPPPPEERRIADVRSSIARRRRHR